MEEQFIFRYHLNGTRDEFLKIPINERRWLVSRFIKQKERENEQIEAAKRKAKIKH